MKNDTYQSLYGKSHAELIAEEKRVGRLLRLMKEAAFIGITWGLISVCLVITQFQEFTSGAPVKFYIYLALFISLPWLVKYHNQLVDRYNAILDRLEEE